MLIIVVVTFYKVLSWFSVQLIQIRVKMKRKEKIRTLTPSGYGLNSLLIDYKWSDSSRVSGLHIQARL